MRQQLLGQAQPLGADIQATTAGYLANMSTENIRSLSNVLMCVPGPGPTFTQTPQVSSSSRGRPPTMTGGPPSSSSSPFGARTGLVACSDLTSPVPTGRDQDTARRVSYGGTISDSSPAHPARDVWDGEEEGDDSDSDVIVVGTATGGKRKGSGWMKTADQWSSLGSEASGFVQHAGGAAGLAQIANQNIRVRKQGDADRLSEAAQKRVALPGKNPMGTHSKASNVPAGACELLDLQKFPFKPLALCKHAVGVCRHSDKPTFNSSHSQ